MNKHKISVASALLMIASMSMAACGGATAAPPTAAPTAAAAQPTAAATTVASSGPVTLNIWDHWGSDDPKGPVLQSVFKDFMAANPDITIKDSTYVDADIPLKVETASAAKQEPDVVFSVEFGSVLNWTNSGVALPVNDYIKQWGLDGKFKDVALSNYTQSDGKIQAFPLEGFTWPIWYNTKVLQAAGVGIPKTTDDLLALATKVRAAGDQPLIASGSDGMGQELFTLIVQSEMSDADAVKVFSTGDWTVPSAVAGVNLFTKLRDANVFADGVEGIDFASGNTEFFSGTVAMSHFGAWSFGDAPKDLVPSITLGGFPLPSDSPHKAPIYYSGYNATGVYITPNGAAKLDAVQKFIQYLYQPDIIARFVEQTGMTPPLKDVPVDQSKLNPLFLQSLSLPDEVAIQPDLLLPTKVQPDLAKVTQEAFTPGTSADKILADLTALWIADK